MPTGLLEGLQEGQIRDLMTFLRHEAPARSRADVEAVLRKPDPPANDGGPPVKPLNIVVVASKQDHGPGQHDYPAWQKTWNALLERAPGVTVANAWEWPAPEQWQHADVIVFYFWNHNWSTERYQQFDAFQARGGGLALF